MYEIVRQQNEQMARIARRERIRANNKAAMYEEQQKNRGMVDLTQNRSPPRNRRSRRNSRDYERMQYGRRRRKY